MSFTTTPAGGYERHHRPAAALDEPVAGGEAEVGDHPQPLLDGDLHLAPCEMGAETAVRAAGEPEMVVALAIDHELVGALVRRGIAVRARHERVDHVALLELDAVEGDVARHLAAVAEDDRVVAQDLLDRRRDQLRLGDQPQAVLGVRREVVEHVAELGACRVEAGQHEHGEHVEPLGVGERASSNVACRRWEARSPARGSGSARRSSSVATQYSRIPSSAAAIGSSPAGSPPKPRKKSSTQGTNRSASAGHADHAEEDLGRIAEPELGHEVGPAARGGLLDEPAAEVADERLGRVHRARGEPGIEDPPVLDVVRRVDLRRHQAVDRIRLPRGDRLAGEDVGVLVDLAHRLVAREHPVALRVAVEEHRAGLAQFARQLPVASRFALR